MFDNIGGKLKGLATVEVCLGILGSVISGIALMVSVNFFVGLLTIVFGSVLAWVASWLIYGVGEAVENSEEILRKLRQNGSGSESVNTFRSACTPMKAAGADEWKCECGRVNKKYVTTCACGKKQFQ